MIRRVLCGLALLSAISGAAAAPVSDGKPSTPGKASWEPTVAKARERAARESKMVFVEFTQDHCGNCERMDALLYPAVNFEMLLLRMVPVKLDRTTAEASALAERYGVAEAPAVRNLSDGGALIFRVNGFDNAPEFYRHVQESVKEWDALHLRMVREPEFQGDAQQELALGTALALRFDPEEAAPRFARAAAVKTADAATRDKARTYLASAQFKMKHYDDSRATIDEILKTSHDPAVREQAELFRGEIAIAEGKREEARRTIMAFLRDHPGSALRRNAQQMLASTSDGTPR
ncbi:MAG TPA: thioredoxin family protein [Thermoanaerobaculia bacterium]|nr:thioredoxin family protein [Thermoanaerobaculia bacterium]